MRGAMCCPSCCGEEYERQVCTKRASQRHEGRRGEKGSVSGGVIRFKSVSQKQSVKPLEGHSVSENCSHISPTPLIR